MTILSSTTSVTRTGTLLILSLFLVSVMMCSLVSLVSLSGHPTVNMNSCNQISSLITRTADSQNRAFVSLLVLTFLTAVADLLSSFKNILAANGRQSHLTTNWLPDKLAVNLLLRLFQRGLIRGQLYN